MQMLFEQMMWVGLVFVVGLLIVKSSSLVSLIICLEGVVLVFLVCLLSGGFMYWNLEAVVVGGVVVSVVVVSIVLSGYMVSVRSFGVGALLAITMGNW